MGGKRQSIPSRTSSTGGGGFYIEGKRTLISEEKNPEHHHFQFGPEIHAPCKKTCPIRIFGSKKKWPITASTLTKGLEELSITETGETAQHLPKNCLCHR